jgi:hypothetical protein
MNVSIKTLAVADDLKIISKFVPGTIARTNPIILFILSMFFAYSCERDNTYMDIDSMPEPGDSSIVYNHQRPSQLSQEISWFRKDHLQTRIRNILKTLF